MILTCSYLMECTWLGSEMNNLRLKDETSSHLLFSFCRIHSLGMVGCGVPVQLPNGLKVLSVTIICLIFYFKGQLGIQKVRHNTEYKI